jgi:hypothetical protein
MLMRIDDHALSAAARTRSSAHALLRLTTEALQNPVMKWHAKPSTSVITHRLLCGERSF